MKLIVLLVISVLGLTMIPTSVRASTANLVTTVDNGQLVGSSADLDQSSARGSFVAKGLHWVFYVDKNCNYQGFTNNACVFYTTSSDGVSWALPTNSTNPVSRYASAAVLTSNSSFVFLVTRFENSTISFLDLVVGKLDGGGGIRWLPRVQIAIDLGQETTFFTAWDTKLSTKGILFITYSDAEDYDGSYSSYVARATDSSSTRFNITLTDSPVPGLANGTVPQYLVPLSNNQMYRINFTDGAYPVGGTRGSLWNGSAWSKPETISPSSFSGSGNLYADKTGNIFLFVKDTSWHIQLCEKPVGASWRCNTLPGIFSSVSYTVSYSQRFNLFVLVILASSHWTFFTINPVDRAITQQRVTLSVNGAFLDANIDLYTQANPALPGTDLVNVYWIVGSATPFIMYFASLQLNRSGHLF